MKNILKKSIRLSLIFILLGGVVLPVAGQFFLPAKSSAAGQNAVYLKVALSGVTDTSGFNVIATQTGIVNGAQINQNYTLTYTASDGTYITPSGLKYVGNGANTGACALTSNQQQIYQISITATKGSYKGVTTVNTCSYNAGQIYNVPLAVTNSTDFGGIYGTISWTTSAGKTQPFPSVGSTVQLTGPGGKTYLVTLSAKNNGEIVGPAQVLNGLPPGNYTLTATYNPTDPADSPQVQTYTYSFYVKAGPATNVTGTAQNQTQATAEGAQPVQPTCESTGFSLSWLICPIINGLVDSVSYFYTNVIQPLLHVTIPLDTNSSTYKTWENFRIYGNIFLIIALLVVVFGESLGGGLIDAYSARKILPRLLVAVIAINLSIYIVAFCIDISNIVGAGIGALIEAPFKTAGTDVLTLSGSTSFLITLAGATGTIWAFLSFGPLIQFLLLFVLVPAFIVFLAILVTVIVRLALIIFLTLIAPVAFALYTLPNTEQYFRKWWDLLFRTLLVYPIIAVCFALGHVMSVVINETTAGIPTIVKPIAQLLSIIALIIPLVAIPYSFRIAGGIIGKLHDVVTNYGKRAHEGIKGNVNDPFSLRNQTKRNLSNRTLSQRESIVNRGIGMQKSSSAFSRALGRGLSGVAGSGNYEERRSRFNKQAAEMAQAQYGTGGDSTVRALFARQLSYVDDNGRTQSGWFGTGTADINGVAQGKTRPDFAASEVSKARQLYGRDPSSYQAALSYEVGKAANDTDLRRTMDQNLSNLETLGLTSRSGETWIGAVYPLQNARKELKHTRIDSGGYTRNSASHTQEVAETVGSWGLSNMRTSEIKALQEDYTAAQKKLSSSPAEYAAYVAQVKARTGVAPKIETTQDAENIIRNVRLTAGTLDARKQASGSFAMAGEDDSQVPLSGSQSGAPGLVNQEIENLINLTGIRQSGGGVTPPPQNPPASEQDRRDGYL